MTELTIGKVARMAGVGIETIRFYERQGLIEQPPRPQNGFRIYPPETIRKIRFIRRAKQIGFSLREIRELLDLYFSSGASCDEVRRRAEEKRADIEQRMRHLQQMGQALQQLIDACRQRGPDDPCPILAELVADEPITGDSSQPPR
ncbi:MerR family mercuric resistance operon transcriptional regulator [Geothermobacter ehrlichii]|uniref:Mercuric resistance operon regulatory protein n=1 Tax=Geothermobacter ehrlichii TaxID=213224 RepID=A0A5D3WKC5_9BACT|nr:MerR family DNA-binding protein [Geothermobacter ehrlichii]TYO97605.1 MerR family mercuric resistance operon transcriptional regulator [Geothermobacter ehrlichii]